MYGVMGKLSFQFSKNENNTDISLYQIYLPKLPENMKYFRLNLFKEIAIGFNQTTLESPANLSDDAFSSSLMSHRILLVSHTTALHT